jgi:hypothetical protein
MNQSVLIVEVPELDDKSVAKLNDFIYEFLRAFESHYYPQLARYAHRQENKKFENFLKKHPPTKIHFNSPVR